VGPSREHAEAALYTDRPRAFHFEDRILTRHLSCRNRCARLSCVI